MMKRINILRKMVFLGFVGACVALVLTAPALAQQVTGVPGSLSATTTIDGKQHRSTRIPQMARRGPEEG